MEGKETREIATKEKQQLAKPQEQTRPGRYYLPDVNIYEFDDSLKLWADMPGVKEKDLKVTLKDGVLTLTLPTRSTWIGRRNCRSQPPRSVQLTMS